MTANSSGNGPFTIRSKEVVQRFLQSVVVLDDLARMGNEHESTRRETVTPVNPPNFGAARSSNLEMTADDSIPLEASSADQPRDGIDSSSNEPQGFPLDSKPLIIGFANLGLVCSVLNPSQKELEEGGIGGSGVLQAAKRADIVVLDWRIGDSIGLITLDVLRSILEGDNGTRRLRLVAIYTGEPGLPDIFERVKSTLKNSSINYPESEPARYVVSRGPLRVAVIPKQGSGAPDAPTVSEKELPDRLVNEFVEMTKGILSNVALEGLAALRDDVPRVLAKFDSSLDSAYLGHRILLPNPADAEDHVVEALGAELTSILEDRRPGTEAALEALETWIRENIENDRINTGIPSVISTFTDPVEMRLELLRSGLDNISNMKPKKNDLKKAATEIFASGPAAARNSDRSFGALLSLKTRYPTMVPKLTLGTILQKETKEEGKKYFLCLQPKCDAVRLKAPTGFPLMPLSKVNDSQRFSWVIQEQKDAWVHLHVDPNEKPNKLVVPYFSPSANSQGEILAQEKADGFYFSDSVDCKYKWVAALKDEHALQIAGEISGKLGRPGPNYSEWLRRARLP